MGKKYDYELYIDASVDIEQKYLDENDIHIIPMEYTIDDGVYVMDRPQTEEELHVFYERMRGGSVTGTSQITPFTYEKFFREAAEAGRNLIYICLSSGLSSTYGSSLTAAAAVREDFPDFKIECVDSLGATGGMGLLLLLAIQNREAGMAMEENAAFLRAHALDMGFWFMVEDLVYLKRGGRISAATALAGSVLNLKPILEINNEGKLINFSKQRGVPRAMKFLLECYKKTHDDTLGSDVIIAHADCRERAEKLAADVRKINPAARIQICPMGPVIGAHTGPGFVAVIHFGTRDISGIS